MAGQRLTVNVGLLKGAQGSAMRVDDGKGGYTAEANAALATFARAVRDKFGDAPVRLVDAAGVPELVAMIRRLAEAWDTIEDVLADGQTRDMVAAVG